MNLIDLFDHGVSLNPEAEAFWQDGTRYSYAQIQMLSRQIGAAIAKQAIADNPHVSVYSPNDVAAFACVLGTHRMGGTWVPLNARGSLSDNIDFLNTAEVQIVFYHSVFADNIAEMKQQTPTLTLCICIDTDNEDDPSLKQFIASGVGHDIPDFGNDPMRQCAIFGTGGTTGKSKGVVHTNLVWETVMTEMGRRFDSGEAIVHLAVAPLTHAAGGICYVIMSLGGKNIVLTQADPAAILSAIEKHKVTHLFLPPTFYYTLLAYPEVRQFDYSSLKHFIVAAGPVAPEKIKEGIAVFGPCITQCWGQAESPMILTWMGPEQFVAAIESGNEKRLLSCGRGVLQSTVQVMDEAGRLLPAGEPGELVVRSNLVSPGYYKNPQASSEIQQFGWHHTGDIGYQDEDGFYYIVDRKKDMIVTGGFNVFGAEVEKVINSHPAVVDAAVIGIPDEKWGESVKAIVQLKPGYGIDSEEIISFCKEELGGVKTPKSVDFIEALPRSPVGKVLKRELREHYWKGQQRRV